MTPWSTQDVRARTRSIPRMGKWGWLPTLSASARIAASPGNGFRDDGILAWLPLAGNDAINRVSIVWSTPDAHAEELLSLAPELLCARVAAAGNHELGTLKLILPGSGFSAAPDARRCTSTGVDRRRRARHFRRLRSVTYCWATSLWMIWMRVSTSVLSPPWKFLSALRWHRSGPVCS